MAYEPGTTGHRILEALDGGALPYLEAREIVGAKSRHFASVLCAMKAAGMVAQSDNWLEMLPRGAEALEGLRGGLVFEPIAPSVRVFDYQGRAA